MKTLLVIFAHPDDESHGPAGTLSKYAHEGVQVHYLCATRGESGTVDSCFLENDITIAALRTAEVQRAAAELGLAGLHFLGYRDSGMEGSVDNQHPESLYSAPLDEVAERIADHIRNLKPDVIITHDQYGWYGHPDHIKCYQATKRAYELLYGVQIDTPENIDTDLNVPRLYQCSFSKKFLKIMVRLMPLFGRDPRRHGQNQDVNLVEIASWDVPLTTKIQVRDFLGIKDRAIACHASQQPLTQSKNWLLSKVMRQLESVDMFSRLYPPFKSDEALETSLFDTKAEYEWNSTAKSIPIPV